MRPLYGEGATQRGGPSAPARSAIPRCTILHVLWVVGAAMCTTALPQPSAAEPLEEIIVTARKVEEDVHDVPMSVQVLAGDWLDAADVTDLYELQFNVPGLVVNSLGMFGAGFALRGVANQGGTSLSVTSHMNGAYLGSSNLALTRLFDLERIEVLKGPQGTLYGRNATGGSINFVTRAPGDERDAVLELAYGSFASARVHGHVNVPFERSAWRVAVIGSESDGYIRNTIDDRTFGEDDYWGWRSSWRTDPSARLALTLVLQHVADDGGSGDLWTPVPAFLPNPRDIRLTTVTLADPFLSADNDLATLNVEYALDVGTLSAVTAYAKNETYDRDDCAGLPMLRGCVRGVNPAEHMQWSQELRFARDAENGLDWLVGINYFSGESRTHYHLTVPLQSPSPLNDSWSVSDEVAAALFAQATWPLATRVSLTGGWRFSTEERRVSNVGTGRDDPRSLLTAENDWDSTSWRVDLEFVPRADLLVYAGIATGFKSGGITTTVLPSGVFNAFQPENLVAYEVGFKSRWPARRQLSVQAAVFFYDFDDLQIGSTYFFEGRVITEVANAARAEIYGLDASASVRLGKRFSLSAAATWMPKREFTEFRDAQTGVSLAGNDLSRAPARTATTGIDYERHMNGGGRILARLEYNYRSAFFFTKENDPRLAQDSFGLVNAVLEFEPAASAWSIFASARNLTDEDYFNQILFQSSPGHPDTYELGFAYRF